MTITPTVTIDASGLNMALSKAGQFTRRAPAQAANTAALEVAYGAQKGLPAVTVDKMDTELAVETTIIRDKTGRVRKKKFVGKAGTSRNFPSLPLAVLIIQARANPQSNYNNLTNLRYAGSVMPRSHLAAAGIVVTIAH